MRIAIVNPLMVKSLRETVLSVPGYDIAWVARTGAEAVKKCASDPPDLILMDPNLPVMDGVEATRQIMLNSPCSILMVTDTINTQTAKVFEAMGHGALDVVNAPMAGNATQIQESRRALLKKIRTLAKLHALSSTPRQKPSNEPLVIPSQAPPLVVIGSSAGGPKTLAVVLSALPTTCAAACVIVQHVDQEFSGGLAAWLDAQTPLPVRLAVGGAQLRPGSVYVAGTNDHLVVTRSLTFAYTPEPRLMPYRPSVDVLFKSVAKHWPQKGSAVLLTGMGRDGAEGLAVLRQAGWHTIAQDQTTSVVYGMPKAAKELGAAIEILPLERIAPRLVELMQKTEKTPRSVKTEFDGNTRGGPPADANDYG